MVLLIFLIGVLNVCLGYALAAHLGYAPPGWHEAWLAFSGASAPPADEEITLDDQGMADLVEELSAVSLDDLLDDQPEEDLDVEIDVEPYDEPDNDDVAMVSLDSPETWDLNEKYVETSLLKLNIAMMKSGIRAVEIDTQLRACRGGTDRETVQHCLALLKEDCQTYLDEQNAEAERFRDRVEELGELKALGEEIEMANLEQGAQIETTLNNLDNMDFESDLEAANQRLLTEIHNLRMARHKLRDNHEVAFLAIARQEQRLQQIESQLYTDPLTKLRNRVGLETTLCNWWQKGRHQARQISAALFDLNQFGVANEEYGAQACDRALHQLAKLIEETLGSGALVARFSGNQFLAMLVDVGPRAAIKTAEKVRQTIENVVFRTQQGEEIRLTLSGGYTEVKPEDAYEDIFGRLQKALKQAKRAGANQACFDNGKDIEPVESPDFNIDLTEIAL